MLGFRSGIIIYEYCRDLEHDGGNVIRPHSLGCLGLFDVSYDLVGCDADLRVFDLLSHAA